ncbi:MAG TPA: Ig-like domain-containing protein, partial [Verrucomicrobiae bacterium]|nr:Ig-like domain-containing protein [Verrucomicrobiae bacterium]
MANVLSVPAIAASLVSLWTVASATNMPPTVAITGYGLGAYSMTICAAETSDPDGTVVKVEYYASNQKIGESPSPPYCYDWLNVPVGNHTMVAVAIDNEGATAASAPVEITIKDPFEARLLTPTNGQVFALGEQMRLTAGTTHSEGAVRIRYNFDGYGGNFPELTNAPYEFTTTIPGFGRHYVSGLAIQEGTDPTPYAWITPVYFYVTPVRGFPIITVQPTNQLASVGTAVDVAVSAFAELPVSYQWQFNGANIPNATNDHLLMPNITQEQAGTYSVLVTTATGVLPSERARIDVWHPSAATILFA